MQTRDEIIGGERIGAKCYACNNMARGQARHNGATKPACIRHRDPSMPKEKTSVLNTNPRACYVCNGTVRAGTGHCWEGLDGEPDRYAHDKCYQKDCE